MLNAKERHTVCEKAAQMGVSEVLINFSLYCVTQLRTAFLYGLPSERPDARDFSATRFDPAIEESDRLMELISNSTSNTYLKMFAGVPLYIRGSRGKAAFHSIPVGGLALDEVDKMSDQAVREAIERLSGQTDYWIRQASTPSIPGFGVDRTFQNSTQDFFSFKCPHCSRWTEFTFPECIVIPTDDPRNPEINTTFLKCKECQHKLEHADKPEFLKDGRWVPRFHGRNIRGFKISQMYSCTLTPARFAEAYLYSLSNPADEQVFHNSKLGDAHIVKGSSVTDEHIKDAQRPFVNRSTPTSPIIVMGIDVGNDLHFKIIEYKFHPQAIDPNLDSEARLLYYDKIKNTEPGFPGLHQFVREFAPICICIDAAPERISSEKFAKNYLGRAYTINFNDKTDGKTLAETDFFKLTVNRTYWMDQYLGRYINKSITIPQMITEEFRTHMKSLKKMYEKDKYGETISRYVKTEGRTDFALCGVYCEIALRKAYESGYVGNIKVRV